MESYVSKPMPGINEHKTITILSLKWIWNDIQKDWNMTYKNQFQNYLEMGKSSRASNQFFK